MSRKKESRYIYHAPKIEKGAERRAPRPTATVRAERAALPQKPKNQEAPPAALPLQRPAAEGAPQSLSAVGEGPSRRRPDRDELAAFMAGPQTVPGARAAKRAADEQAAQKPKKKKGRIRRAVGGFCAMLGVLLLAVLALLVGGSWMFCKGPSMAARDLFVNTMMETSALKFVPALFLEEDEIRHIQEKNAVIETGEVTQTPSDPIAPPADKPLDTIEIEDVSGPTFKGKMMLVYDPSRLKVACLDEFSAEAKGRKVSEFIEQAGAVAGINAGGFADENGMGKGGMPLGIVIRDGKMLAGSPGGEYSIIGFDENDRLIVGRMTGAEAMERKVRDAVSFGPAFIINGQAADISGTGGGLNPRTVLGQREDGTVLILVIDGRQPHSLGANYQDCVKVMQDYGAINAANLDGGSSSQLIYQGETINVCSSLYGPRDLPTAFIVQ